MITERETELRIEAWLHDEARPMPAEVLEASIEAVARTGQISAQRPVVLRWLADRRVAAFGAMAAVLVLAVVIAPRIVDRRAGLGSSGSNPGPSPGLVWDAEADFRRAPNQQNPGPDTHGNPDVWRYMRSASDSHDPATYTLLPDFKVEGDTDTWYEEELFSLLVGSSRSANVISMHPWSSGNRAENHHAILAWRSPITGTVALTGEVEHIEPTCVAGQTDGTTLFVDLEDATVASVALNPGQSKPLDVRVDVVAGQSLYFVLDPGRASNCDATQLSLSITQLVS